MFDFDRVINRRGTHSTKWDMIKQLSGWIFDLTGSYRAAFLNGIAWNLVNVCIALFLFYRKFGGRTLQAA